MMDFQLEELGAGFLGRFSFKNCSFLADFLSEISNCTKSRSGLVCLYTKKDKLLANAMVEIINAIKCSDCPCH